MKDLKIFKNNEFGEIQILEENGKFEFEATSVAKILGYSNPNDAIQRHCKWVVKHDVPHPQSKNKSISKNFISEGDLYRLITHSKLEGAEKFECWIFDEVLPNIRKTGGYIAGEEKMTEDELIAQALIVVNRKLEEKVKENEILRIDNSKLTVQNQIMQPKAEYFDELVDRNLLLGFRDTAKELGIKQSDFINFLLDNKYIYRNKSNKLMPYAHKNDGLFEVKESVNTKTKWCGPQTMLTPKGRETFRLLYLQCIKGER